VRRRLRNILVLGVKEFASLASDTVLLAFIVYSFSLSVYSIATSVQTEVVNASVAIVDGDRSVLSARLKDALLEPYFRRPAELDRAAVDAAMDQGRFTFVLDVPPGFEADLLRGYSPAVQLNIDATAMTQAGVGAGYIEAILVREVAEFLQSRGTEAAAPIKTVTRAFFNPNLEGSWFQAVMAVVENVTTLSILLVGAAVMRERERGTIEHLLVMPLRASEIALAKIWANSLVILLASGLSLTLVVRMLLGVPIEATSLALFLLGTAVYLFATTSLGILLATATASMPQFALLAIPVFLILTQLSGANSPLETLPTALRLLLQVSPALHHVSLAQAVLYRGAGLDLIWPELLALAGIGAVFLALALARFRTMLARQA
jgi:ABC-2 type transport system permease protein